MLSLARACRRGSVPIGILYYHRVADVDPGPWTIGQQAFETQINWLEKNFDIVPLAEAQQRIRRAHNSTPTLCITFDDGYADNSSFALPLLIRRSIPFTYFVTTTHPRTGSPFAHDVARGSPQLPNSVATLQALLAAGVEIGGHTRNHPDLGKIEDPEQLFDEVITATRDLEQMLGHAVRYFAFPFGQLENLNPHVFGLARRHGFAGVCSAYGGWNEIGEDAFHLQRFHGDPELARIRNWLTRDPRNRHAWQTRHVEQMLQQTSSGPVNGGRTATPVLPPLAGLGAPSSAERQASDS